MASGRVIVRTLDEAREIAGQAPAVISLVNDPRDAPECSCPHIVCTFPDEAVGDEDDRRVLRTWAEEIVAFARTVGPTTDLLVHCHYGQSRSPAAALLVLCAWGRPIPEALEQLDRAVRGRWVTPYPDLVAAGDAVLGLDGALADAVEEWCAQRWAATHDDDGDLEDGGALDDGDREDGDDGEGAEPG